MFQMNWQWIAGFFEGEGHIYWQEGRKGTKQGLSGRVILGQKEKAPLEAICLFLIKEGFGNPIMYQRKGTAKSGPIWILALNIREDVIRFLQNIEPMLFQKKDKASWVINRLTGLNQEREQMLQLALELRKQGKNWHEIGRETGIGKKAILNHFRAKGISVQPEKITYLQDRIDNDLCATCGEPRGKNGTRWFCRQCADIRNQKSREQKAKAIAEGLCADCRKPRGKDGTKTLCRQCADKKSSKLRIK